MITLVGLGALGVGSVMAIAILWPYWQRRLSADRTIARGLRELADLRAAGRLDDSSLLDRQTAVVLEAQRPVALNRQQSIQASVGGVILVAGLGLLVFSALTGESSGRLLAQRPPLSSTEGDLAREAPAPVPPASAGVSTPAGSPPGHAGDLSVMVQRLAKKMADNPVQGEGWVLLGRSYVELGRHAEAAEAFGKAIELMPRDADLQADLADALVMADGGRWTAQAREAVQRALALAPRHSKGLALAATEAFRRDAYAEAIAHWQAIVDQAPAGSTEASDAQAAIDEARRMMGGATANPSSNGASRAAVNAPTAPLPVSALMALATAPEPHSNIDRVAAEKTASAGKWVDGLVELGVTLRSAAKPGDTVFIVARPIDGSRMPLAVVRTTVDRLPYRFRLDDSTSMTAQHPLSGAAEVIVQARLSASGQATAAPDDPVSEPVRVKLGTNALRLVLAAGQPGRR